MVAAAGRRRPSLGLRTERERGNAGLKERDVVKPGAAVPPLTGSVLRPRRGG